jgi:hypothetical protein
MKSSVIATHFGCTNHIKTMMVVGENLVYIVDRTNGPTYNR